jgi:vacuolar-type H+-ATPase subunit E/Vma4
MPEIDGRMELIGSAIISQAEQEARELREKATAMFEREVKQFENELLDGMFGRIQAKAAKIRHDSVTVAAREELDDRRALLTHRTELTERVFSAVAERLKAYAKTGAYEKAALENAEKLKARYGGAETVIFVTENDKPLGEKLAAIFGGALETADDIALGGFRLLNPVLGVLLDETLDEKLAGQRQGFLETCGLNVEA